MLKKYNIRCINGDTGNVLIEIDIDQQELNSIKKILKMKTTKQYLELNFTKVHTDLLKELIPFFGNNLGEVIKYASIRFLEDFIFQNKFSIMREELKRLDNKK